MIFDLSTPQKSIWITEQFYKDTNINNITGYFNIAGQINEQLLVKSINIFIENNEILRARFFLNEEGKIQQKFLNYEEEKIEIIDLKTEVELENLKVAISKRNFEVLQNKLYSFYIYNLNNRSGGIIFSAHHLIWDAWSMSLLINDIANIYYSLINNEQVNNSIIRPSYKEYIYKEKKYLEDAKRAKDEEYWTKIFSEEIFIENKEVSEENIEARRKEFILDSKMVNKFKNIDKSFLNIFISALSIYFSKIYNIQNMLFGLPLLNRSNYFEKQIVGMFVNTVPFRIDINKETTFKDFLDINKKNEINLFRHQRLSYEKIFKIAKEKNSNIKSLFDIVVSYQNARDNRQSSNLDYNTGWIFNKCLSNSLDIHLTDLDDTGELKIFYDYQTCKYSEKDISNMHDRIMHILEQVLKNKDILIRDIEIVTLKEKEELMEINNLKIPYDKKKSIIDLFKIQVKERPNETAIIFEDEQITYKELDIESDKYAQVLIDNNVNIGDIVGVYLPKSLQLFIAIIGILKAGAIYLPIDISFPNTRVNYMLKDSKSKICITTEDIFKNISTDIKILNIEKLEKNTDLKGYASRDINGTNRMLYYIYFWVNR